MTPARPIIDRVLTLLPGKLVVGLALTVVFAAAYYGIQFVSLRPVFPMPATWFDRAIPFRTGATPLYLSWYVMLPVVPLLVGTRDQLRRYALGLFAIGVVGDSFFLLCPTGVARPLLPAKAGWMYRLVVTMDKPVNACPSIHAALAVFTALWFARLCAAQPPLPLRRPRAWIGLMWLWAAVIFYGTIATRQHVVLDLIAGAALAGGCYALTAGRTACATADQVTRDGGATPRCVADQLQTRRAVSAGVEPDIAELQHLSAAARWAELTFFPALWLIGATVTMYALHLHGIARCVTYAAGLVLSSVALNAFVLLLHEGMHQTLFAGRFFNRWVSVALGGSVLISFTAYQVLHLRHHTYLGDARDPDDYHNYSRSPRVVWMLHYVRLLSGAFLYVLLIPILVARHGSPEQRRRVAQEYFVLGCVWALALALVPNSILVHAWLLPLVLVGYMTNVRGFTQHGLTDAHDPLLASRSMRPNRLVSFLLLNENLHLEHHLFPEIPSYHLGRLRQLIEPNLPRAVEGRSYLGFLGQFVRATFRSAERSATVGLTVRNSGGGAVAAAAEGGIDVSR